MRPDEQAVVADLDAHQVPVGVTGQHVVAAMVPNVVIAAVSVDQISQTRGKEEVVSPGPANAHRPISHLRYLRMRVCVFPCRVSVTVVTGILPISVDVSPARHFIQPAPGGAGDVGGHVSDREERDLGNLQ